MPSEKEERELKRADTLKRFRDGDLYTRYQLISQFSSRRTPKEFPSEKDFLKVLDEMKKDVDEVDEYFRKFLYSSITAREEKCWFANARLQKLLPEKYRRFIKVMRWNCDGFSIPITHEEYEKLFMEEDYVMISSRSTEKPYVLPICDYISYRLWLRFNVLNKNQLTTSQIRNIVIGAIRNKEHFLATYLTKKFFLNLHDWTKILFFLITGEKIDILWLITNLPENVLLILKYVPAAREEPSFLERLSKIPDSLFMEICPEYYASLQYLRGEKCEAKQMKQVFRKTPNLLFSTNPVNAKGKKLPEEATGFIGEPIEGYYFICENGHPIEADSMKKYVEIKGEKALSCATCQGEMDRQLYLNI
jgi:hypothetical protein